MSTYVVSLEAMADGALLRVGFGSPAQNDQIEIGRASCRERVLNLV